MANLPDYLFGKGEKTTYGPEVKMFGILRQSAQIYVDDFRVNFQLFEVPQEVMDWFESYFKSENHYLTTSNGPLLEITVREVKSG